MSLHELKKTLDKLQSLNVQSLISATRLKSNLGKLHSVSKSEGECFRGLLQLRADYCDCLADISFYEAFPQTSAHGFRKCLFRLSFVFNKRKLVNCLRCANSLLAKSLKYAVRSNNDKAVRYLGRSIHYLKRERRCLDRFSFRINTEANTVKTVQIQIQQRKRKM